MKEFHWSWFRASTLRATDSSIIYKYEKKLKNKNENEQMTAVGLNMSCG